MKVELTQRLIFAAIFVYVGVNLEPGLTKYSPFNQQWLKQTPRNGGSLRWLSRTKQEVLNFWACVTTKWGASQEDDEIVWSVRNKELAVNKYVNTTVATITTPTYSSGVAGLNGVKQYSPSSQRWLEQTLNIGGSLRWLSRHTALVIGKVLETTKGQLVRVDGIVRSAIKMKLQLTQGVMIVFAAIRLKIVALRSNLHRITCQSRGNLSAEAYGNPEPSRRGNSLRACVETRGYASLLKGWWDSPIPNGNVGNNSWIIFGVNLYSATRLRSLVQTLNIGGRLKCSRRGIAQKCEARNDYQRASLFRDGGIVWSATN